MVAEGGREDGGVMRGCDVDSLAWNGVQLLAVPLNVDNNGGHRVAEHSFLELKLSHLKLLLRKHQLFLGVQPVGLGRQLGPVARVALVEIWGWGGFQVLVRCLKVAPFDRAVLLALAVHEGARLEWLDAWL